MLIQEITRNLLIKRSSKTKYTYLGLLFSVYFILWLYRLLRIPPHLRHFRSIGYFKMLGSFLRKESIDQRTRRLVFPNLANNHTFYLSRLPSNTDWTLYTLDPVAASIILSKTSVFPMMAQQLLTKTNPLSCLLDQNSLLSVKNAWKEQRKVILQEKEK